MHSIIIVIVIVILFFNIALLIELIVGLISHNHYGNLFPGFLSDRKEKRARAHVECAFFGEWRAGSVFSSTFAYIYFESCQTFVFGSSIEMMRDLAKAGLALNLELNLAKHSVLRDKDV